MQFVLKKICARFLLSGVIVFLTLFKGYALTINLLPFDCYSHLTVLHSYKYHTWSTDNKISITLEFQELYSSHSTFYTGGDILVSSMKLYPVVLGVGSEISHCPFHNDNNWNLTNLYFAPVFLDNKWCFWQGTRFVSFIHLSEGISFANYTKKEIATNRPPYHVSETGFYLFSGLGIYFKTGTFFTPFLEMGFKGYHMSFNALDVNPHGMTFRAGLIF